MAAKLLENSGWPTLKGSGWSTLCRFGFCKGWALFSDSFELIFTSCVWAIIYKYDNAARPILLKSSLSDAQHPATMATVSIGYYPSSGRLR